VDILLFFQGVNNTPFFFMQKYHHLTASKRGKIQALKAAGATLKHIK
jgi:hypothetical protein